MRKPDTNEKHTQNLIVYVCFSPRIRESAPSTSFHMKAQDQASESPLNLICDLCQAPEGSSTTSDGTLRSGSTVGCGGTVMWVDAFSVSAGSTRCVLVGPL